MIYSKKSVCLLLVLFVIGSVWASRARGEAFTDQDFISGMVLKDAWSPGWGGKYLPGTLEALKNSGSRWVGFHHFWSYSSTSTPVIESSYGSEGFSNNADRIAEFEAMVKEAKAKGYKVFVIPSLYFGNMLGTLDPGQETNLNLSLYDVHTSTWYDNWFNCYAALLDEVTEIAERTGVDMISLGFHRTYVVEDMRDGYDTTARWRQLIARVRSRYSGKVILLADSAGLESSNTANIAFWDALDYIGVHVTGGISTITGATDPDIGQITHAFQVMFSTLGLAGYYENLGKKTILVTAYSSSDKCFSGDWFEEFEPQPNIAEDQDAQADLYSALFASLSTQTWVAGVLPWGYWWKDSFYNNQKGDASFEKGPSVRGKKAETVIASYMRTVNADLKTYTTASYTLTITPENGPMIVSFPQGCFSQNVDVRAGTAPVSGLATIYSSGTVTVIGSGLQVTNTLSLQPSLPIGISMSYREADIPAGVLESSLAIARYNDVSHLWEILASSAHPPLNKVTAETSHVSLFSIIKYTPAAASVVSGPSQPLIIYPNPFHPLQDASVTISGFDAGSTIHIYSISGDLIRTVYPGTAATSMVWDGKNNDFRFSSSGVYIVTATGPLGSIKKAKIGIIK